MNQRGDGKFRLGLEVGFELNDSLVVIFGFVFDRQTAESFTGSAASAASPAFFLRLDCDLNLQTSNVVRKMLTGKGDDLLWCFPLEFQ